MTTPLGLWISVSLTTRCIGAFLAIGGILLALFAIRQLRL
jgi:hypothetical protein